MGNIDYPPGLLVDSALAGSMIDFDITRHLLEKATGLLQISENLKKLIGS